MQKKILKFVAVIVTCASIIYLLKTTDLDLLSRTLAKANLFDLFCAFLVSVVGLFLHSYRWELCLSSHPVKIQYLTLTKFMFISNFFNNTFLSVIGGEVYKTTVISKLLGFRFSVMSVAMAKATNLVVTLITPICIAIWVPNKFFSNPTFSLITLTSLFALFCFVVAWLMLSSRLLEPMIKKYGILKEYLKWALMTKLLFSGFVFLLLTALHFYLISKAFSVSIDLISWIYIVPSVVIITMLPISLNGLGMREFALVILLGYFGIGQEVSVAIGFSSFLVALALAAVGGAVLLIDSIKRARQENISQ